VTIHQQGFQKVLHVRPARVGFSGMIPFGREIIILRRWGIENNSFHGLKLTGTWNSATSIMKLPMRSSFGGFLKVVWRRERATHFFPCSSIKATWQELELTSIPTNKVSGWLTMVQAALLILRSDSLSEHPTS